jgi:hypothetical protein
MDLHAMMLAVTVIFEKKGRSFERLLLAPILRRSLGPADICSFCGLNLDGNLP